MSELSEALSRGEGNNVVVVVVVFDHGRAGALFSDRICLVWRRIGGRFATMILSVYVRRFEEVDEQEDLYDAILASELILWREQSPFWMRIPCARDR